MPDSLPISRAARAAGVSRKRLQQKITDGELTSFEGMVMMDELFAVFPPARFKESAQIARMQQIKESAVNKSMPDDSPSEFTILRRRVDMLEKSLQESHDRIENYQHMIVGLVDKIEDIQAHCDNKQKMVLETLLGWIAHNNNQNRSS